MIQCGDRVVTGLQRGEANNICVVHLYDFISEHGGWYRDRTCDPYHVKVEAKVLVILQRFRRVRTILKTLLKVFCVIRIHWHFSSFPVLI